MCIRDRSGSSWASCVGRPHVAFERSGSVCEEHTGIGRRAQRWPAHAQRRLDDILLQRGTRLAHGILSWVTATRGPRQCTLASDDRHRPTPGGLMSKARSTKIRVIKPEDVIWEEALHRADETEAPAQELSLIHISEPTRLGMISYAVF